MGEKSCNYALQLITLSMGLNPAGISKYAARSATESVPECAPRRDMRSCRYNTRSTKEQLQICAFATIPTSNHKDIISSQHAASITRIHWYN